MIIWLSLTGLFLSVYMTYVHYRSKKSDYTPICDISTRISCSLAAKSKYGALFGFANGWLGIVFYPVIILVSFAALPLWVLVVPAVMFSLVLAYISFVIQKNICPICLLTYIINIWLLVLVL